MQSTPLLPSLPGAFWPGVIAPDRVLCMDQIELNCVFMPNWIPGGNTPQDTNCTATCPLSRKLFKLDEPDMQDTAGEAGTNS